MPLYFLGANFTFIYVLHISEPPGFWSNHVCMLWCLHQSTLCIVLLKMRGLLSRSPWEELPWHFLPFQSEICRRKHKQSELFTVLCSHHSPNVVTFFILSVHRLHYCIITSSRTIVNPGWYWKRSSLSFEICLPFFICPSHSVSQLNRNLTDRKDVCAKKTNNTYF